MNPKARKDDLVTQDLNGELFVYDLKDDKVYSLNETSAFVWQNLDGETSVDELSAKASRIFNQPATEDLVWLAIDELSKFNLLEKESLPKAMSKLKRREVIKRIGLASLIALPVISMLVAPTALNAASVGIAVCQPCVVGGTPCATGSCKADSGGSGFICGVNTSSFTYPSGFYTAAFDPTSCNSDASQFCCKGTATYIAVNGCKCN